MTSELDGGRADAARPRVDVLYFDGCPNHEPAVALIERVGRELGLDPEIRLVRVPDHAAAERQRFLGSPTVRVGGRDVDPHAAARRDYGLSCRVFRTDAGIAGQPDERWVREALLNEANQGAHQPRAGEDVVERALQAADIPPARRRRDRARQLGVAERSFYRWILRRFADASPPRAEELRKEAERLALDLAAALTRLAREDLVHSDGEVVTVAYPFSARARGHLVLIDGERRVEAMCAIDALGIAPMLDLPIEVSSRDPVDGSEVWVRLDPGDGAWWEPGQAVVLAGSPSCGGPSFRGCCDVLNFFASLENAQRYLDEHPEISGFAISIPDAIEAGRTVFGDVLADD